MQNTLVPSSGFTPSGQTASNFPSPTSPNFPSALANYAAQQGQPAGTVDGSTQDGTTGQGGAPPGPGGTGTATDGGDGKGKPGGGGGSTPAPPGSPPGSVGAPPPGYQRVPQQGMPGGPLDMGGGGTPQQQQQPQQQDGGPIPRRPPYGPTQQGIGGPAMGMPLPQIIANIMRQQQMRNFLMNRGRGMPGMPYRPPFPGWTPPRRWNPPPFSQPARPGPAPYSQQRSAGYSRDSAMDLIKRFEGWDRGQWDGSQYSTGYGTKARYPGERIDQDEANSRLRAEIAPIHERLNQSFPNMTQNVSDALTSFSYNLGVGWMQRNPQLVQALRNGDYQTAGRMMMRFVNSNGRFNPGLYNRRAAEVRMLLQPQPQPFGNTSTYGPDNPGGRPDDPDVMPVAGGGGPIGGNVFSPDEDTTTSGIPPGAVI